MTYDAIYLRFHSVSVQYVYAAVPDWLNSKYLYQLALKINVMILIEYITALSFVFRSGVFRFASRVHLQQGNRG